MIIHQPEIKIVEGQVIVSSRVETISKTPLPENLWFKYPLEYIDAVSDRADAFFTTLFLLGMHLEEDVEVRGDVSPKLANNIEKSSSVYLKGNEKSFSRVNYQFDSIKVADPNLKRHIKLCSFSGGVDSFYAYWSHHFPNRSDHPVNLTHGLFIQGFDFLLQNQENYQNLYANYQKLFGDWGLSLIKCSTNAYSFYQFRVRWGLPLIPTLAGAATALENQVSTYLQPGNYDQQPIKSTLPSSNIHLFSTETLDISCHANILDRPEKLIKIMDWEPPQKHLRICLNMNNEKGIYLCQKCAKCLNTGFLIFLHNKQDLFPAFSKEFTYSRILLTFWSGSIYHDNKNEFLKILKERKRFDYILMFLIMQPIISLRYFVSEQLIPLFPRSLILAIKNVVYPKQK